MYAPIIPLLEKGLASSGTNRIVDLGSGGGGGLVWLNTALHKSQKKLRILLTDFYPNLAAFEHTKRQADNFDFVEQAVDARNVPSHLKGLRTLFLSFHHFKPADAKAILQSAMNAQQPIAIFEAQERSAASLLAMFFSPITVLLTTPFIRPFSFWRLFFTYIIPFVPMFVWWDGIVSSLRTYSVQEMHELVQSLPNHELYKWEIGRKKSGPGVILYLLGTPAAS